MSRIRELLEIYSGEQGWNPDSQILVLRQFIELLDDEEPGEMAEKFDAYFQEVQEEENSGSEEDLHHEPDEDEEEDEC
jgi:hypothetical protein